MDQSKQESDLAAQLRAEVRRGVRSDLDLWPAIRAQVRARQAATRRRPAFPARSAALAGGILLAVGLIAATLALMAPPRSIPVDQAVVVARQLVITDPRLARTLHPSIASNASPEMYPPVQTLALTITVALEQVTQTPNEAQAVLRVGLTPADSPAAAWTWVPEIAPQRDHNSATGPVAVPPRRLGAGRWSVGIRRSGTAVPEIWPLTVVSVSPERTLTVTRLTATDLPGGAAPIDLPGPWTFTLPDLPAP